MESGLLETVKEEEDYFDNLSLTDMKIEPKDADMKENVVKTKFYPGDLVFAKMKGYPTWPAKVLSVVSEKLTSIKYSVYFFGTGNSAVCAEMNVFAYTETKALYGKPLKYRGFQKALDEIQEAASLLKQDMYDSEHGVETNMDDGEALNKPKAEPDFERVSKETNVDINFENMENKENAMKRENDEPEELREPVFVPVNVNFEGTSEETRKEFSENTEMDSKSKEKLKEVRVQMQRLEESTDPEVQAYFTCLKLRDTLCATSSAEEAPCEEDEDCAAETCFRPTGSQVLWVQCDARCNKWFHFLCEGLEENDLNDVDEYICNTCRTQSISADQPQSSSSDLTLKSTELSTVSTDQFNFVEKQEEICKEIKEEPMSPLPSNISCEETIKNETGDGETQEGAFSHSKVEELEGVSSLNSQPMGGSGMPKGEAYPYIEAAASGNESSNKTNRQPRMECSFQIASSSSTTLSAEEAGINCDEHLSMKCFSLEYQYQMPSAVASCSTDRQKERQVAAVGQNQPDNQSERDIATSNNITSSEEEMQTSASLRGSYQKTESKYRSRAFACFICKSQFHSKYFLNKHMRVHAGEEPYKCSHCYKSFHLSSNLTTHLRIHTGGKPYKCSHCEKSFRNRGLLNKHMHLHTVEKFYRCTQCGKSFHTNDHLSVHMRIHLGERPYKCSHCDKSFKQRGHLINHMRLHTGEKPYRCSHCDKSFHIHSNLTTHFRIHSGERPYKCCHCEKSFRQKSHLIKHMHLHTDQKLYRCSQCDKSFHRNGHLSVHMRCHMGERPYKCIQCDQLFVRKDHLIKHMHIHMGLKPYRCSHCEKSFRQKDHLTNHTRLHTGERPYRCSQCDNSFHTSSHLSVHMRHHMGDRPHKCSHCGKSFQMSSNLTSHLRIHKGEKPYKCSQCEKSFRQRGHLIKHMHLHTNSILSVHMHSHMGERP